MSERIWSKALLAAVGCLALTACKPESFTAGQPAPRPSEAGNSAPVIAGSPNPSVSVGSRYTFQPTAYDNDGDSLSFSATGLPAWASIDSRTGLISGTPSASDVGTTGPIVVRVSDGYASASLPAFQITVSGGTAAPPLNQPPTISGTPVTNVVAGSTFSFTPTAQDPEGGNLTFSIRTNGGAPGSRPSWASFDTATGSLTGTVTAGTYNIVISVTDPAGASASLSFSLTVEGPTGMGMAELRWNAPTQNTDGSPLTDLRGYKVYQGTDPHSLKVIAELTSSSGPPPTTYTVTGLASHTTYYFTVTAFNSSLIESEFSEIGSKNIP